MVAWSNYGQIDLISDLHVDRWPDHPLDWHKLACSPIAVVAGDVSDSIAQTMQELGRIAQAYQQVLFVHGNHEFEASFSTASLAEWSILQQQLSQEIAYMDNVHFLPDRPVIIGDVAFIGQYLGWDYRLGEPYIHAWQSFEYIREFLTEYHNLEHSVDFLTDLGNMAVGEALILWQDLQQCEENQAVNSVVMITHTLPRKELISWWEYPSNPLAAGIYGNSHMHDLLTEASVPSKLKLCLFGHNHKQQNKLLDGVRYISNPRGRPADFNRVEYAPLTIDMRNMASAALSLQPVILPKVKPLRLRSF
ncbi:MAG: metallophosphoesterase [Alphaproteobacteria bacterium]